MTLPHDICRCRPARPCPLQDRCARYVERDTGGDRTPFMAREPEGCEAFIPVSGTDAPSAECLRAEIERRKG